MKKKITAIALVVAILAVGIIGGTLAYFTDTDNATNTFTLGNVAIQLNEKNADGTNFTQNQVLRPGSQTTNKIAKRVSITNTGSENAYVWYEWYIPSVLDSTDGSTGTHNVVHVNSNGNSWDNWREDSRFWPEGQTKALPLEQTWDHDPEVELGITVGPEGFFKQVEIDGIQYNKYVVLYHGVLAPKAETTVAMNGVYLDSKVDCNEQGQYTINGTPITYDFTKGVNIIVKAYGIQAEGFADVYAAYNAYQAQTK